MLWDVLLLFIGLGFAGIGAVNLGTAPIWFGLAALCAVLLVIDAIRRNRRRAVPPIPTVIIAGPGGPGGDNGGGGGGGGGGYYGGQGGAGGVLPEWLQEARRVNPRSEPVVQEEEPAPPDDWTAPERRS